MTLKHEGKLYLWNNKNAKNIKSEISTGDFSSYIENMRENYSYGVTKIQNIHI